MSVLLLVTAFSVLPTAGQDSWPQFRGPGSSGIAEDMSFPEAWGPLENVARKAVVDVPAIALSVLSAFLLIAFRVNSTLSIIGGGAVGLLVRWLW